MAIVWLLGIGCPPKQNKQCSRPTQQPSCLKSGGNRLVLVPGTGKRSCLPPLLQVHLVGLESTALQKRLAHAAAYWVVGWKRCVFFCFFLRQTQKQTTNQTRARARARQDEREDKPEHASSVVSERSQQLRTKGSMLLLLFSPPQ